MGRVGGNGPVGVTTQTPRELAKAALHNEGVTRGRVEILEQEMSKVQDLVATGGLMARLRWLVLGKEGANGRG